MREPSILGGSPADVGVPGQSDPSERATRLYMYATLLLLVFGAVPWRTKQYFSGQFDWVVLGKTGLLIAALLVALWARDTVIRTGRPKNMVPALPLILAVFYMGTTVLGARLFGNFYATVALSARALVIAFAILVLIEIAQPMIVVDALARVLSAVAVVIALTGSFGPTGRLRGSFPPLSPNEIAFLAAVPLLYFVWRTVNMGSNFLRVTAIFVLGGIIFLTHSRTTTVIALIAVLFLVMRGKRNVALNLSMVAVATIGLLFALSFTQTIQDFTTRGDPDSITTLSSRTIAWDAALHLPESFMQTLLGKGLSTKTIPVAGQMWQTQVLDSSWVSAFVHAGILGVVIAGVLIIYTATRAARIPRPDKDLWLALLTLVVARSVFESGLVEASVSFVVLMVVSLGCATQAWRSADSGGKQLQTGV